MNEMDLKDILSSIHVIKDKLNCIEYILEENGIDIKRVIK